VVKVEVIKVEVIKVEVVEEEVVEEEEKEIIGNLREEKEIISKRSRIAKLRKVEKEEEEEEERGGGEEGGESEMEARQLLLQSSPQHFGELPF